MTEFSNGNVEEGCVDPENRSIAQGSVAIRAGCELFNFEIYHLKTTKSRRCTTSQFGGASRLSLNSSKKGFWPFFHGLKKLDSDHRPQVLGFVGLSLHNGFFLMTFFSACRRTVLGSEKLKPNCGLKPARNRQ